MIPIVKWFIDRLWVSYGLTWRSLFNEDLPGLGASHEDGHRGGDDKVDVQELHVAQVGKVGVQDQYRHKLEGRVLWLFWPGIRL